MNVKNFIKCKCGKKATWCYMPSDTEAFYCDDCVPRGCTCNHVLKDSLVFNSQDEYDELCKNEKNLVHFLDDNGRELPCCEFLYDEEGWNNED